MGKAPSVLPRATMSREAFYDDGSGPRCGVSFDTHFRLGSADESYVTIEGVGGEIHVLISDLNMLRSALAEVESLEHRWRAARGEQS